MGAKKKPFYRIVVANSINSRDGTYIEAIGTYNPQKDPEGIQLNAERAQYWLSKGAQPTEIVGQFLKQRKIRRAPLDMSESQENKQ
jgi:small subunit ribosomal protein S16